MSPHRISVIEDGLDVRYVEKDALSEIIEFQKYAISTRDSASQLDVVEQLFRTKPCLFTFN